MRSLAILLILVCIAPMCISLEICKACQNSTCSFFCYGQKCQAYYLNDTCNGNSCLPGYYGSHSPDTLNISRCVACNYTFAGCVLCSANTCTQCQPGYFSQAGICYTQRGYPVGQVFPYEQIWIAFVVLFTVMGTAFLVMYFLKNRAALKIKKQKQPLLETTS